MNYAYGKEGWDRLWETLEQEGNVGLDYVINPYLYTEIIDILAQKARAFVVDFGCGTNLMGIQLLYGYAPSIPALQHVSHLDQARFNTMLYLGLEGQQELVNRAHAYLQDIGGPVNIATVQAHIGGGENVLFDNKSVDLCVSRNFLMHLSVEDYEKHIDLTASILKEDGYYIFATLNPDYEILKAGSVLKNGDMYNFQHGKSGEYGTFFHYYKTVEQYESALKGFEVEKKIPCMPIRDDFRHTHERYYDPNIPMAFVYVLKKR